MTMRLASILVDTATHAVELRYVASASELFPFQHTGVPPVILDFANCDVGEIIAYAVDLTEGRCRNIKVFEGGQLVRNLVLTKQQKGDWLDIAGESSNG